MLTAFLRSEVSGDLAFDTKRPDVPSGLVVVEQDAFVIQEKQHRLAVWLTPQGQVPSR